MYMGLDFILGSTNVSGGGVPGHHYLMRLVPFSLETLSSGREGVNCIELWAPPSSKNPAQVAWPCLEQGGGNEVGFWLRHCEIV